MDEDMLWLIIGIVIAIVVLVVIAIIVIKYLPSFLEIRGREPGNGVGVP